MNKLVLILLLSISGFAYGQLSNEPEGQFSISSVSLTIKGKVVDQDTNQNMEYASISLFNSSDSTLVTGGVTDQNGIFSISGISPGNFYVVANFIGFARTRVNNIEVTGNNRQVDLGVIMLSPATATLGEVQIVAEKARVEYRVDKKVVNVSQAISATGGTAVDALENAPSVQVDLEGNVTLRGSSNFMVLINGRPSVLSGSDALQQIPASTIENIEIITNPSARYEAEGTSGIINVVMKKEIHQGITGIVNTMVGTKDKYRADATLNYNTGKMKITLGGAFNNRQFSGTNRETRETFTDNDTTFRIKEGDRGNRRYGREIRGGIDLMLSDATTLGLSANYGKYGFEGEGHSTIREYNSADPSNITYQVENDPSERQGNYVSTTMNLMHKFDDEGKHKLEAMLYYSFRDGDVTDLENTFPADENFQETGGYDFSVLSTEKNRNNDYRLQIDYTRPLGLLNTLEMGYQTRLQRSWEDFILQRWDEETGGWQDRDPDFSGAIDFNHDIHAGYLTLSGKVGFFQYMAGLRTEYAKRDINERDSDARHILELFDFFPTAHIAWELFTNNQIMASYSRRINRPNGRQLTSFDQYWDQNTIILGNPNLRPEYTNSIEAGMLQRFGNSSFISFEAFYRSTKDLISRVSELGDDGILYMQTVNVNSDNSIGGELMADMRLTQWLKINASTSVYKYSVDDETTGEQRTSTNMDGRLNASLRISPVSRAEIIGEYRGPSVTSQGDRKGMFFTNFSYRHDFFKNRLSATLSLQDAFGTARYEGTEFGPNYNRTFRFQREPRTFTLTLSYKINNFISSEKRGATGEGEGNMDFDF